MLAVGCSDMVLMAASGQDTERGEARQLAPLVIKLIHINIYIYVNTDIYIYTYTYIKMSIQTYTHTHI